MLLKKVNNANPGDADHFGGNDLDKISDYFNDINVSETPRINNPTEYRSGILNIRDGSNAFNVAIKSATQTATRDFTIPALAGNDSPATLALANNFTAMQQVTLDADTLLSLYRPTSTTNAFCGLAFLHRNSSNASVGYASISSKLITNTAGLEDGKLVFYVKKAGVTTEVMSIDKNGLLTVASVSATPTTTGITVLKNTGVITTTASSSTEFNMLSYTLPANTLGANGALRVRISGFCIQNQATDTTFTIRVKFGGTTIFDGVTASIVQGAGNRPFIFSFTFGNNNSTAIQSGTGRFIFTDGGTVSTVGDGDIGDDEVIVNSIWGTAASTKDTTSSQALVVTMQHSVNNALVSTAVRRQIIEFVPGV